MVKSWFHGQSGRLLVIFDHAEHRTSISTISFLRTVSGCHYHDPERASAGDGGAGGGGGDGRERARRLDFQAKRAVGGHKERLLEGVWDAWHTFQPKTRVCQ
jgi:hypothetical protein